MTLFNYKYISLFGKIIYKVSLMNRWDTKFRFKRKNELTDKKKKLVFQI